MDPYLGEIRIVAFNFSPKNWADCDGRLLTISEYPALYALLGVQFGGNGSTNFGLPDLRGRVPVHPDTSMGIFIGLKHGYEQISITQATMPNHSHGVMASSEDADARRGTTGSAALGKTTQAPIYGFPDNSGNNITIMYDQAVSESDGGDLAHNNIQPSMVLKYIIALTGVFPARD